MTQSPSITIRVVNRSWIEESLDNVNTNNHKYSELPARLQAIEVALDQHRYYRRLTETGYDLWKPILQRMQREAKSTQEPIGLELRETISPCNEGYEIILTPSLCRLLKSAADGGLLMGRIPRNLQEDLEEQVLPLLVPYFGRHPRSNLDPRYFVRLNSCSPKDGMGEQGPFEEAWPIILSLCTSERVQKTLRDLLEYEIQIGDEDSGDIKLKQGAYEVLHLNPWRDEISTLNEFRLFVPPNGKVRAISQYSVRSGGWADDSNYGYRKIKSLVPCMIECNTIFRALARDAGKELPKEGYVLDVHVRLLRQENSATRERFEWSVEPIEINPFGAQLASGSGLFRWLTDWECMYGFSNDIIVALVYDDSKE
ncbi:hypothetical protein TWF506_008363 [Arthrobotrys conoides]|uniref:Uncharacterized protein n=1 Tax=Arthrobotrys conoides TaxID=74498 RepID=A0AAN8RYA8_9PEZI